MWMRRLVLHLGIGILGFWSAGRFVSEVEILNGTKTLIFAGLVLGLLNYFVKPILKTISLPLRIITLGLFGFVISMAIVWLTDILFPDLMIKGLLPLFWTTVIVWGLGLILPALIPKTKRVPIPEE